MMTRACIREATSLLLLLTSFFTFSQPGYVSQPEFFAHLKENKLYAEQRAFIKIIAQQEKNQSVRDTLFLQMAFCSHLLKDSSGVCSDLENIPNPPVAFNEKNKMLYRNLLFTYHKTERLQVFLNAENSTDAGTKEAKVFLAMMKREKVTYGSDSLLNDRYPLKNITYRYTHRKRKSALAAGLFSAVVPGLGKLYAGYKYQAFSAFLSTTLMGAQGAEAYFRSGVRSAHFIYAAGIFSVYYLGNITGSVWAVKKKKRDTLSEIDYEIASYYTNSLLQHSD